MKTEVTPKDKVFQTAARLFYQHGYRAIGVDTIAAESGIGKMTLYRHYPSKDDLIVAYLKDSNDFSGIILSRSQKTLPPPAKNYWHFFKPYRIM